MAKKKAGEGLSLDDQIHSIAQDIPVADPDPDLPEVLKHRNEVLQKRAAIAAEKANKG